MILFLTSIETHHSASTVILFVIEPPKQNTAKTAVACEGSNLQLNCDQPGQKILITEANYGRTEDPSKRATNCRATNSLDIVKSR
jgi:hypothetical protein